MLNGHVSKTTQAEQIILEFLFKNKGIEYTAEELEEATGVRSDLVDDIMDNLRWKGFEVATERHRGVHYFINNTWKSWAVSGLMLGFVVWCILYAYMNLG